jgi:beta-xylosidase
MLRRLIARTGAILLTVTLFSVPILAQDKIEGNQVDNALSKAWVADNGDGRYSNPIIHADYPDPDVIRVGDDFYMTASSSNAAPGLPILHSRGLVNWTILGHVFTRQPPFDVFSKPQHGNGVWAPAIRYHSGEFYIYYPDPDYGIYLVKAKNPAGPWSEPLLIKEAKKLLLGNVTPMS